MHSYQDYLIQITGGITRVKREMEPALLRNRVDGAARDVYVYYGTGGNIRCRQTDDKPRFAAFAPSKPQSGPRSTRAKDCMQLRPKRLCLRAALPPKARYARASGGQGYIQHGSATKHAKHSAAEEELRSTQLYARTRRAFQAKLCTFSRKSRRNKLAKPPLLD